MRQRVGVCHLAAVLIAGVSVASCSGQSPVMPTSSPAAGVAADGASARGGSAPAGTYTLSFFLGDVPGGLQPLAEPTLEVNQYLVLRAHVADAAGQPARTGSVSFEYCSVKGAAAPRASCETGSGSWKHHMTVTVDSSGFSPHVGWGACSSPRSIGFRFRYSPKGSGIASGASAPTDATWTAVE